MPGLTEKPLNTPLRRPEIEELDEFVKILANPCHFDHDTSIDILESKHPQHIQKCNVEISSHELLSNRSHKDDCAGMDTQVIFLDFLQKRTLSCQNQLHITAEAFQILVRTLEIPITFVEGMFQQQIWDGSGCFVRRNEQSGRVERIGIILKICYYGLAIVARPVSAD
jgi:hypothetical protein